MSDLGNMRIARAKKHEDNREWNLRDMCEYIIAEIDNGDEDLKNSQHALLIYETAEREDGSSNIWHVAMKCNFSDRLELVSWHKHFLFGEWMA